MKKVVLVERDEVVVAMEDNSTQRLAYDSFTFRPEIGDLVEIFEDNGKAIVHKATVDAEDKININITNAQAQNQVVAYTNKKPVSKLVYALLAILIGSLGAHKFYAGKMGTGILFLLFSWTFIPGIIGFIEGIISLFAQEDENGYILV